MKKEQELLKKIENTFTDLFKENGLEFVEVEYVKAPKGNVLRIFIDKDGGVDLDSCELASNIVSSWLDEVDPIEESYFLEVSSPGLERPIKPSQIKDYLDKKIYIKCYKKIEEQKEFIGYLKSFDEEVLSLKIGKDIINLDRKNIAIIKSQVEF